MGSSWIIFLVLVPLFGGIASLLLTGRRSAGRIVAGAALMLNMLVALSGVAAVYAGPDEPGRILVSQMGNWPAPFGISLVLDPLAAIMLAITSIVLLTTFIYCLGQLPRHMLGGFFPPLYLLLAMGVQWSILTGDLFNLFVGFEIMLMASYVILIMGTTRAQMRQAYKYILLNLLASMMFVTSCGLIYGHTGTLNMADLARLNQAGAISAAAVPAFATLLIAFGLKAAVFPLWFWLPDSYPTMHPAIGGLFSGLLTKVGAYVLVRMFVMTLGAPDGGVAAAVTPLLAITAGITMFGGVLGAVSMQSIRRILSIHVISQVGYMVLGVALALTVGAALESRAAAIAGTIFFIIHNMIVKCCLFLCGGLMQRQAGTDELPQMGGLVKQVPWLATLFFIAALSLAGLPPLSGFFGKFILIREAFAMEHHVLAIVAIATSLLTLMSMLKIWSYGFWSPPPDEPLPCPREPRRGRMLAMTAVAALVVVALSMGLFANVYYDLALSAARSIVDPTPYIDAVLGPVPTAVAQAPQLPAGGVP